MASPTPAKLPLFTQHSRSWQANHYVYPVLSRRSRGLSIGVNLNPDKICNFDCIYCCVDRTVPPTIRDVELPILEAELDHLVTLAATGEIWNIPPFDQAPAALRHFNDIAFSGDGEPSSFKDFPAACGIAADLLARHCLRDVKIVVITNATLFHRRAVAEALRFLDRHNGEIWAKLDAGTDAYYHLVERTKIPLRRVLDNILAAGRVRPIVIQSLFMRINGQGPDSTEIAAFVSRLTGLATAGCQIKRVQVYTVARQTAEAYVTPLTDAEVDAIGENVRLAGLSVETYYGPD